MSPNEHCSPDKLPPKDSSLRGIKDAEVRADEIRYLKVRLTHQQSIADDALNEAADIKTRLAALMSKYQVGDRVRVQCSRWLGDKPQHHLEVWEITKVVYENWRTQGYRLIGLKVRKDGLLWNRAPRQIFEDEYGQKILGYEAEGAGE